MKGSMNADGNDSLEKIMRSTLVLIFLLALVCPVHGLEMIDQVGRRVEVDGSLSRVVSLAPNLTEISYQLGAGTVLVGATRFASYPDEARSLPKVGSYVDLDIEKIVSLNPQLCLAIRDGNPKAAISRLEALGIPVYVFDPQSLEEIIDTVVRLGTIYGRETQAKILTDGYGERLERVSRKVQGVRKKIKVFFQIDAQPLISAGKNTFLHQLLIRAGAINLAADRFGYPRFSWEELLVLRPEVVLIASMNGGLNHEELLAPWEIWPQVPAVSNNRLYIVDADLFNRPTLRLIEGLEVLVNLLYPELDPLN